MLLKLHLWLTENGSNPLPLEEEHCTAVEVTEEEVQNSVKFITSLSTVVSRFNTFKTQVKYLELQYFTLPLSADFAFRPFLQNLTTQVK